MMMLQVYGFRSFGRKHNPGQARRNANDGISSIQTAEGATNQGADILKRMRELATQSSSETLHNDERSYIQSEFQQLSDEIDRISDTTEFNGIKLTDGESSGADTSRCSGGHQQFVQ